MLAQAGDVGVEPQRSGRAQRSDQEVPPGFSPTRGGGSAGESCTSHAHPSAHAVNFLSKQSDSSRMPLDAWFEGQDVLSIGL